MVRSLNHAHIQELKSAATWETPIVNGRIRKYEPGFLTGLVALALVLLLDSFGNVVFGGLTCASSKTLCALTCRMSRRTLPAVDHLWVFLTLVTRQSWLEANRADSWLNGFVADVRRGRNHTRTAADPESRCVLLV